MKKIIVADDEKQLTTLVCDFLNSKGYNTLPAYDGKEAIDLFKENLDTDLIILDIMMPDTDGWEACREIRKISDVPVLFLSARAEEFDQLMGFESGADDYVTKPFSLAVLQKRIEALLRRTEVKDGGEKTGLYIDDNAYSAFLDGKQLQLTLKEFELLSELCRNNGKVLTRDQLLLSIWGYDYMGDSRTVDSHIARLRTKLGEYGNNHLKTIYGLGYKIEV